MTALFDLIKGIAQFIVNIVQFVINLVSDLISIISLMTNTLVRLPVYLSFLPTAIVSLLLVSYGIVFVYKATNRT